MKRSNVNLLSTGSRAANLPGSSPGNWAFRPTGSILGDKASPRSLADVQGQLDAALRENRHLREQRDILKKHWAFSPNRP
jgi:hypothetical protein